MAKVMATDSKMFSFQPINTKMAIETNITPLMVKTAGKKGQKKFSTRYKNRMNYS